MKETCKIESAFSWNRSLPMHLCSCGIGASEKRDSVAAAEAEPCTAATQLLQRSGIFGRVCGAAALLGFSHNASKGVLNKCFLPLLGNLGSLALLSSKNRNKNVCRCGVSYFLSSLDHVFYGIGGNRLMCFLNMLKMFTLISMIWFCR